MVQQATELFAAAHVAGRSSGVGVAKLERDRVAQALMRSTLVVVSLDSLENTVQM
jgi:hypothetical protein